MLLRVDDRLRVVEQTATLPAGIVAYVPNGQPGKLVWNAFPFAAGYSDYAAGYQACGYSKDASGIVTLRGLFKYQTISSYGSWSPGVLPAGYRPIQAEIYITAHSSTGNYFERIDILSNGAVNGAATPGNWDGAWGSLAGVSFDSGTPMVVTAAGAVIPDGWLFADGRSINPARYGQLTARLNANALPDLRGSAPLGTVPIIKF